MQYTIHPMTIDHYDAVFDLWRKTEGIVLSDTDEKEPMRRFLSRNPGLSLVARCGDKLAGAILCSHDGRRGYLHHLVTVKQFRCYGIGSALVQESLARLSQAGIRRCNIFLLPENREGITFWERNGFRLLPRYEWMQAISDSDD